MAFPHSIAPSHTGSASSHEGQSHLSLINRGNINQRSNIMKKFISIFITMVAVAGLLAGPCFAAYDYSSPSENATIGKKKGWSSIRGTFIDSDSGLLVPMQVLAATATLTANECGQTLLLAHATEFTTTLPALSTTQTGCTFKFVVQLAPAGANYVVGIAGSDDIEGSLRVNNAIVACANETAINFVAGAGISDHVTIIDNGTDWFIVGSMGDAAGDITCTGG